MSTSKNGQISLYCHFNKTIREHGTSFQSAALSQKHVRNVCHTANERKCKCKCNFHYVAMLTMTSHILKSVDSLKTKNLDISRTNYFSFKQKIHELQVKGYLITKIVS